MYSGKEGAFVLKMVRWHRQKKNNGNRKKRIASAVCMLGVLVVCLGVVGYRNKLKADEKLPVMTRGVVDQIEQIPESKRNIYDANAAAAKLGTKENPFLILEIVPYEEYAEFGYSRTSTMFLLRPNSGCSTDNRQYGSVFVFRRCG